MTKRWLSEEHLANLPPEMTKRAMGTRKPRGAARTEPEHLRMPEVTPSKPAARGGMQAMQALGRLKAGELNKTEEAYRAHLDMRRMAGEVLWYSFEPFRLNLAPKTTYTADFLVQLASGHLEVHEVKGFWTDDARVKIKVAAKMLPVFKFVAIKRVDEGKGKAPSWAVEEF